ncbi:MAG: hypothetical protein K2V38_25035 [Gemmataceae bacterium]|nr:hypothetical protein [Gemmataceae bacterium]
MGVSLRRYVVVQLLMVWQGGFLFYSACVVPVGTSVLGSAANQGAITARVTDWLNLIGAGALVALLADVIFTRDPHRWRRRARWAAWGVMAGCQVALAYLHLRLEEHMDPDRLVVLVLGTFRRFHGAYLWAHTLQWVAGLAFVWLTLRAWRAADGRAP